MSSFDLGEILSSLSESDTNEGLDFTGKSLKLDTANDAKEIVDAINNCEQLHFLTLTGNTLGVAAAEAIAKALEKHPEFKIARWADMFTGRMKSEIPPALSALGNAMIAAGAKLSVLDLSDNAFGPIGVEGLAKLLQSEVCSELQELRLNNNGLGITGGRLLANALTSSSPPRLRVFVAGRNRLENEGAISLAQVFQKMGSLEEISMPQNGIYHVGITALSEAFKHNPHLRVLNLNDNTIGAKGAKPLSSALSSLKELQNLNLGDCLLKSKGANIIAKPLKEIENMKVLDMSHNEIGTDACIHVVECITTIPDYIDRLDKVILAGNNFHGRGTKRALKDQLGDCAQLSDGETDTDEDGVSEEESEEEDEDSATEDAQHSLETSQDSSEQSGAEVLNQSGVEEVEIDVETFLQNPTLANFQKLGPNVISVIDTHLQIIKDPTDYIETYVEALFKICGLCSQEEPDEVLEIAKNMYPLVITRAGEKHGVQWLLANAMLMGLGLIKSERKNYEIKWDLARCYKVLSTEILAPYFPRTLRETLRFFIQSKREKLASTMNIPITEYPSLCTV